MLLYCLPSYKDPLGATMLALHENTLESSGKDTLIPPSGDFIKFFISLRNLKYVYMIY